MIVNDGASPIQGPGFIFLFLIMGPVWAWRMGKALNAGGGSPG